MAGLVLMMEFLWDQNELMSFMNTVLHVDDNKVLTSINGDRIHHKVCGGVERALTKQLLLGRLQISSRTLTLAEVNRGVFLAS